MARIHLGTSGWLYRDWRGRLYPAGLPTARWLERYAEVFSTVEINGTFYRLPSLESVDRWRDAVPRGFVFACKGSRFLTHMKQLTDVDLCLERYFERVLRLGAKLGPVLWQLPARMRPDADRLAFFLDALPPSVRHVFEFRDEAWYSPAIVRLLERRGVALCEHDLVAAPIPRPTGGFRYLRFHGTTGKYRGRYGRRALAPFARDLVAWRERGHDAYVYFNNDLEGHAVADALDFAALLGEPVPDERLEGVHLE